jgi:hypothetical protein
MIKKVGYQGSVVMATLMLFVSLNTFFLPEAYGKTEVVKKFTMNECTPAERALSISSDCDGNFWLLSLKKKDFNGVPGAFSNEYGYYIPSCYNGTSWKTDSFPETIVESRVNERFQKCGDGYLYLLTATAFIDDNSGRRFTGGPIFKQTSSGWKRCATANSFPASYYGVMLSDSTFVTANSISDTVLAYKNGEIVKRSKIDTSSAPVTDRPEFYADEDGGSWVLWDSWHNGVGLYYWNGDSCSLVIQEKRLSSDENIVKRVLPLPGGGVAVTIDNLDFLDTVVFIKNHSIGKKKYAVPTMTYNYFPDSLERLWAFDSTKAWVNNGTESDTLLASSLSFGKIRDLAVSHNASVSAVLCDSGVVIFKPFFDPASVRPRSVSFASYSGRASPKVQLFSLTGRVLTGSNISRNQIVIERGVDLKTRKCLLVRNQN